MSSSSPPTRPLIRKLASIAPLSQSEQAALLALPAQLREIGADHDVVREGDTPSRCCLVVEGFACRAKLTRTGKRQILSFHTPGDLPDLPALLLGAVDYGLATVTACRLAFIPHEALRDLVRAHPGLAEALWRDTLVDAAIFQEWLVGTGRRPAETRIAHLLCELAVRLRAVGLGRAGTVPLPITQTELGDALGLSTVHVNRTLQELRAAGLFTWGNGVLTVHDWDGLAEVGEFDPAYLHVRNPGAA